MQTLNGRIQEYQEYEGEKTRDNLKIISPPLSYAIGMFKL